ncbi:glycosyltransferase [Agathobaculum sp. NTUH-O15-33]|uniref:glycosyltransferase n=1 Tax=Agathobaculum sp. NTUH-O15-33 TaxID=3079302 RepID=UPI002958539E|nr:glycosyltransferase [Agathobaculum sp. NTUH-O15-33]WNX84096.1 glycosyltransferase [Agathobaculum sp. NTUH-O15-33]
MVLSQNTNMYSDGSLEDRIIGYLKEHRQYADRIIKDIPEGAVFHNFSAARENLLRWYPFDSQDEVLEIGAGMGALTPYLCSVCRHVTAVEPSQRRAEIISLRCNEMDNVQIVNGTIHDIVPERLFDKILLIGVLEYSGISGEGQDPWLQLLTEARAHLKPTGKLLLAIENRCGLKYWCGAAEDHTGIPFDSLNNYEKSAGATERYQGQNGVRTFDRETLQKLLSTSGFAKQKYYYPLPDYKFPMLVLSDNSEDAAALAQDVKYSYSEEAALVANESELIATVIENNCLGFFANSFFVEAMTDGGIPCSILTSLIKRDYAAQYRIATVIKNDTVQRLATSKESVSHLRELEKNTRILIERGVTCVEQQCNEQGVSIAPRIMLPRADAVFAKAVETDNTALAYEMLERLREALLKSGQAEVKDGDTILEKGFLDMTFRNSFWNGKELLFFDQEWKENKVPLKYLLYRSIHYACRAIKQEMTMPFYRSCKIQPEDMDVFEQREQLFLKNLMDPVNCQWFDGLMYQERLTADAKNIFLKQNNERLTREKERLQGELKRREGHIELLLQSERDLKAETKRQDIIIAKLEDELRNKTGWVEQLMQSERELKQEVLNKEGHIQLLLKSDRELNRIKSSRSWRFMEYFWRLRDFLIPQGSRRRLAGKVLVKFVKHPLRFLSKCTPKRIRKFFSTVQREGVDGTSRRLNDCLTPASLPETQIALEPVNVQAVKSVKDYERLTVPQWENPAVSIVIPVYNQFDFTYACIKSILGNSGEASYEIIIADDCSMDLTVKIKEIISGLRVIRSQKNLRFLLNCNHAAKQAKGQYILFLNNDTQVQENWLQPLLDLMNADDSIGLIGSKLVYPDGRLQEAGGILWRDGSAWNYGNRSDPALPEYNYVKEADYISGASIMIRRALWEKNWRF